MSDDTAAINNAITAGIKQGPGTQVFVPAGKYMLLKPQGGAHVHINGAVNFTLYGEKGTELSGGDPNQQLITVANSRNVTICNLIIEMDKYYFTQGVVVAQGFQNHTIDLKVDPSYPELDAPQLVTIAHWTIHMVDPKRLGPYIDSPANFGVAPLSERKIGDHLWRLQLHDFHGWPPLASDMQVVGQRMLLWDDRRSSHGIDFENDQDCVAQDVTWYGKGVNAGFFLANCSGTMTFRHDVIGCPPRSDGLLSCSGGGQFIDMRGSLVFDHCDYSRFDDDGADIFTSYKRVHSQNGDHQITVDGGDFRKGDHVGILDWANKAVLVRAIITSVIEGPGGDKTLTVDQKVGQLHTGNGTDGDRAAQENDETDRVTDYDLACSSVIFSHCLFQCNRARPLNLKCQNCTVTDCDFTNCAMAPIEAGAETWWGEAPDIHHLTIRGNRFYSFNQPAIDIGTFGQKEDSVTAMDNEDILIDDNRFDQYGGNGAIRLRNAQHVVIKDNWFGSARVPLKPGREVININHCSDVVQSGNKGV